MELTYSNHTVRIVQNPSDIIVRFTEPTTNRNYETTFTERSFIEYQVFGGLEFVSSLLQRALQDHSIKSPSITQFKATPKEIRFSLTYSPDSHCKMTALEFVIPAIKKDSANADVEALTRQVQALVKLTDTLKSSLEESKTGFARAVEENRAAFNKALEDKTSQLQRAVDQKTTQLAAELEQQKAKVAGFIVIPGIRFVIDENTPELNLSAADYSGNPGGVVAYSLNAECQFTFKAHVQVHGMWQGDITNLKYLKKCKRLTIASGWDIKNFSPISQMLELEHLNIVIEPSYAQNQSYTSSFQGDKTLDISFVKTLKKLTHVSFYGYKSLKDISPLASCPALKSLDIRQTDVGNTNCLPSTVTINK
jgi:hypothetical protein